MWGGGLVTNIFGGRGCKSMDLTWNRIEQNSRILLQGRILNFLLKTIKEGISVSLEQDLHLLLGEERGCSFYVFSHPPCPG